MTRPPAPAPPVRHDDVAAHDVAAHDIAPHDVAAHDVGPHDVAPHDIAPHDIAPHGRLDRLRRLGRDDLVGARLAEAHTDTLASLVDLDPADRLFAADPSPAPLGRVGAAEHTARCTLAEVARLADAGADVDAARLAVARARVAVETSVDVTLTETGRATGPGPLVTDAAHARHVADLQVYVRQSLGDRDLAALGRLVVAGAEA